VLAVYLQLREPRTWVKRLGWAALGAVIAQGLLGGLTVKLNLPLIVSAAHATLAQLFFLITVSLAVFTSKRWIESEPIDQVVEGPPVRALCIFSLAIILTQLVLGATLRHSATWDQDLPTSLLVAHICGAVVVTLGLSTTIMSVRLRFKAETYLTRPAVVAAFLLVVQLGLGVAAFLTRRKSPLDPQPLSPMVAVTVAHVACGALVFAATIVLTLRIFRLVRANQAQYRLAHA